MGIPIILYLRCDIIIGTGRIFIQISELSQQSIHHWPFPGHLAASIILSSQVAEMAEFVRAQIFGTTFEITSRLEDSPLGDASGA